MSRFRRGLVLVSRFIKAFTSGPPPTIVFDSFTRADNAISLGAADTGQSWTYGASNTWGIQGNRAYSTTTATNYAFIDSGKSEGRVTCTITWAVNEGVVFRSTGTTSNFFVRISNTGIALFRNNGSATSIGEYLFTPSAGAVYVVSITFNGPSIKVYLDGVERISVSDTFNQTATVHGLRSFNTTGGRYDDFKVEVD